MPEERLEDLQRRRAAKVASLRARGIEPYPLTFERTHTASEIRTRYDALDAGAETGERASVAGRIVLKREIGKLAFLVVRDATGDIQVMCERSRLGEAYALVDDLDLGDWIGASGEIVKTRRGELSVRAEALQLLAKSLRPLPEKWHGLQNVEQRYRQRYVDLAVNDDARRVVRVRSRTVAEIRAFLVGRGFIEVETPMLQPTPGGALARPFVTHMNALDIDLYLRIAPELYLKRLIVGGLERVFEINRNFRNEGVSVKHNPEFTMLEAYQAYTDYFGMMELMESMVEHTAQAVLGTAEHTYQGKPMPLVAPFRRARLVDLVSEAAGAKADLDVDAAGLAKIAEGTGVPLDPGWGAGKILLELYEKLVEPHLFEPTFVMDFPREVSPLARPHRTDPRYTEHFDLVIAGTEAGPAYSELTDPVDQRARFEDQGRQRAAGDEEAMELDEDFLRALEYGMPPTGGLGFGIDRFTMILADVPSIRDVILFPLLRPEA
jgi:lysyl-tRNA synthetase class 2